MAEYPWFPVFIDLSDRRALVVGAGKVAARRVATLTKFCAHVDVVGPRVDPTVEREVLAGRVTLYRRVFEPADLDGRDVVIAATDDAAVNAAIAEACRKRGIPVNVSSDRTLCDFYVPGVAVDGDVAVGVTASGRGHRRAKEVTRAIREMIEGLGNRE